MLATPGVTPPQQPVRTLAPGLHAHNQVQHVSLATIECEVSSAGRGGGCVPGLVDGGGGAVTGPFVCTQSTPPASQP